MKKKKIVRVFIALISLFLLVFISYLAYLFFSYHRLPDNQEIAIEQAQKATNEITIKRNIKLQLLMLDMQPTPTIIASLWMVESMHVDLVSKM